MINGEGDTPDAYRPSFDPNLFNQEGDNPVLIIMTPRAKATPTDPNSVEYQDKVNQL